MAPEAPDPKSLKSWHDAFQYPIPTVRRVEQELRRDIASNKEKLRALVGTRYRELVGTAETIVAMNNEIQEVESILADVGRRCNPRLVEKKHTHARQIKGGNTVKDAEKHAYGAQLALLHRCTTTIARLLRKRVSLLLVAKILVVSRLLLKTLSENQTIPPFLEDLRNQLASLRQTLLKRIDKRLASSNTAEDNIVESLAAFCLATSSSADDAIHHFHQVRLDVIARQLDLSRDNIPQSLRLFIHTLQTSKVLRSRQFAEVLSKLKARPILSDPEIRSLDGLDIEVLGRWAAPAVNNFTPWIKLSELSRSEAVESIKEWSLQAFEKLSEGCQQSLATSNDFAEILSLRATTLELWLVSWASTITHHSVDVLERLRSIFNNNLKRVLMAEVQTVNEISQRMSSIISSWETTDHVHVGSVWDYDLIVADYSNGAAAFKQTVADRLLGRDDDVSAVMRKYQTWLKSIQDVKESIESLRSLRWTDVLVGGGVEDDDVDITPRLNSEDPRLLSEGLHTSVRQAFDHLQSSFTDCFKAFGTSHLGQKATFLLRVIRLVRRNIPVGFVADDFLFCGNAVPELQKQLATEVVAHSGSLSLQLSSNAHQDTRKLKIVPGRSLWEGEFAVPVQPSPGAFKYLRCLTATMDENGTDLWDPSTVKVLKEQLREHLEESLRSTLDKLENWSAEVKDEKPAEERDEKQQENNSDPAPVDSETADGEADVLRDWKIQLFFDSAYLEHAIGGPTQLKGAIDLVQAKIDLSAETTKAIQKGSQDYWKRTELLFGLLAQ
ncbi:hypothetical protein N7512_004454 [Penicillium capsulatum]|nr:hypothetical protein N7512_004454 [Penicillium capsulatum]